MAIAVLGIAVIPGVSDAAQSSGTSTLHVSVKPGSGSTRTHFVVSFKAAEATGVAHRAAYRLTASDTAGTGCQANVGVVAPATPAGATVRVKLAPSGHGHWCAGTFHGQVWYEVIPPCPTGTACPEVVFPPLKVGTFRFRVTRS
jgi:hypothetical protein